MHTVNLAIGLSTPCFPY